MSFAGDSKGMARRVAAIALALPLLLSFSTWAQDSPETPLLMTPREEPPEAVIRLNTGEWLRGRVALGHFPTGRESFSYRHFSIDDQVIDERETAIQINTRDDQERIP